MITTMTGEWSKFERHITVLSNKHIIPLMKVAVTESGEIMLKALVGHVQNQDLPWYELSSNTIERKGNNIVYVETGALIDNLVNKEVINRADTYAVFVGAPARRMHMPSGLSYDEIMIFMEFGTVQNVARPLVQPTFEEMKKKITQSLVDAVKELLKNN